MPVVPGVPGAAGAAGSPEAPGRAARGARRRLSATGLLSDNADVPAVSFFQPGVDELLERLRLGRESSLLHVERVPARAAQPVAWPSWVPDQLRVALAGRGITAPWSHQAEAAGLAHNGRHVVIATGTASGKSLAYLLPVLARLSADPRATALYLSPTKALAADQLRSVQALTTVAAPDVLPSAYDGDTPSDERAWVRSNARIVLTNPDMLHRSILPHHADWSSFLRRLAYVVIDESHVYRGLFGSHVALVMRRLRRVVTRYGRTPPVFIVASATAGDPQTSAGRLTGLALVAVTGDGSPRGRITFGLWEPPLLPGTPPTGPTPDPAGHGPADAAPIRRSAAMEAASLLTDTVIHGVRTLAFVRSRRSAEVVAAAARRALREAAPELAGRVAAYRGGYLREERRELEQGLIDGSLLGLATTNALELGIDVAGLDAVILAGYPGSIASMWQQAGRAGRSGADALCLLIARDDPLDTYLVRHPAALFGRGVEATVLDPTNPYVLAPHLCCAAAELPLTEADVTLFGPDTAPAVLDHLVRAGSLRHRPTGWYWATRGRPDVDLRGSGAGPVSVVEAATGRLLGTVDRAASHAQVHQGAVYLHQGATYVVERLDVDDGCALVRADNPDWSTHARDTTGIAVQAVRSYVDAGPVGLFLGDVEVTSQVVGYQRRRLGSGEVLDTVPLKLPSRRLRTVAVWWTVAPAALARAGITMADVPGSLHAAEHASIGLLPLIATCDRWDIGGLSTTRHEDTGAPTVFVYDGHLGGAGFAEQAYAAADRWLSATRTAIADCACETGCPSCVQSPKCGNGNDPLHKTGAVAALDIVLAALADPRTRTSPGVGEGRASPAVGDGLTGPAVGDGLTGPAVGDGSAGPAVGDGSAGPAVGDGSAGPAVGDGSAEPG